MKPRVKTLRGDHNQCPSCGQLFNSTFAFDKHRVGSFTPNARRCLTVDEMTAIGMERRAEGGYWVSSARPSETL